MNHIEKINVLMTHVDELSKHHKSTKVNKLKKVLNETYNRLIKSSSEKVEENYTCDDYYEMGMKLFHAPEPNYNGAIAFFGEAVEMGHIESAMAIAWSYLNMDSTDQRAVEWFKYAADRGHVKGMFYYGQSLVVPGPNENKQIGIEWMINAGSKGLMEAQEFLGDVFLMNEVVPQDIEKAKFWYNLAARQGSRDAEIALEEINL